MPTPIFFRKDVKTLKSTEVKFEFEISYADENGGIPVIIVAAGNYTRMNGINKQLLTLNGIPVIARTLLAFEKSRYISRIILVTREEDIFTMQLLAEEYSVSKLTDIVKGGKNRQESVLSGLNMLGDEAKVLIQDGARPFVTEEIIKNVAENLNEYKAVTCGIKVKDTIKKLNPDGTVRETLNREELFAVQTPQGVTVPEYRAAIELQADLSVFTDDMSIMEAAGHVVKCVEGSYNNIKITTPEDIIIAENILKKSEQE